MRVLICTHMFDEIPFTPASYLTTIKRLIALPRSKSDYQPVNSITIIIDPNNEVEDKPELYYITCNHNRKSCRCYHYPLGHYSREIIDVGDNILTFMPPITNPASMYLSDGDRRILINPTYIPL